MPGSALAELAATFPGLHGCFRYTSSFERMASDHGHGLYPELNYGSGAKWMKNLTKDRLGGFNGGRYSQLNLASVLFTHRLDNPEHVKLKV